jgi:hypothetical protein
VRFSNKSYKEIIGGETMAIDTLKKINSEIIKLPESKQLLIAKMIIDRIVNEGHKNENSTTKAPNPLADVWGKCPGDESIDEILKMLEHTQDKLAESEFSLEGMFTEGEPIPKEAIDEVIKEWERE